MAHDQKMKPMSDEEVGLVEVPEPTLSSADGAIDALAKLFADRFAFHLKAALATNEQPKEK